jgi:hypothetical protein
LLLHHVRILVTVGFPDAPMKHLNARIVDLIPRVETTTLTQRSDRIRECMVNVVKKHLIPAVSATKDERHNAVEAWPAALWVTLEEMVPSMRMSEVSDKHPSRREAESGETRNSEHESPRSCNRVRLPGTTKPSVRADKISIRPNARPQSYDEAAVLETARQPLLPKLLVALARTGSIGKRTVPFARKEGSCVVETEEMDYWDKKGREYQTARVNRKRFLSMPPGPLKHPIL